jgi:di/tricarboxylate transporter
MNVEAALVFAILAVAVLFFSTNWVRPDLVALLVLVALVIFGLVTPEEALSGFSSQAVIAIAALLIISAGLVRSGAVRWLAGRIGALAGGENRRLSLLTTAIPGFLSGFVNVIAMVSLFIPLVARLARRNEIPRSKLLLPMAVAGLVGANLTLIGASHNLVVSSLVVRWGVPRLSLFELFPVGAILLLGAILYAQLMGDRLLPDRSAETREEERRPPDHLVRTYHLEERLWELWVMPESPAVGRSLRELGVGNRYGLNVISVVGESPRQLQNGEVRLQNGDVLLVTGREERVDQLVERNEGLLFIGHPSGQDDLPFSAAQLAELVVPPRSPFIGRNLVETGFREKTGLTGVALWRGGPADPNGCRYAPAAPRRRPAGLRLPGSCSLLRAGTGFLVELPASGRGSPAGIAPPGSLVSPDPPGGDPCHGAGLDAGRGGSPGGGCRGHAAGDPQPAAGL